MENILLDNITIVLGCAVLLFALFSSFFSPFFRMPRKRLQEDAEDDTAPAEWPSLTVILTPDDEEEALQRHLPLLLHQDYPAFYQVVVVIKKSDKATEDLLTRLQQEHNDAEHTRLYVTYIPAQSRYLSQKKLAITLGVKAAATEWVILTEAYTAPATDQWLRQMACQCKQDATMVIGYGHYDAHTSAARRFLRFQTSTYLLHEDVYGLPYRTVSHNLMFRKTDFMQREGFRGSLHIVRGEYDFLVNKYGGDHCAVATHPQAFTIDDRPTRKTWIAEHIAYFETRKCLERGFRHRAWFNLDQVLLHANFLLTIGAIFFAALTMRTILLGTGIAAFLLNYILRSAFGHRAFKFLHEPMLALAIYPMELFTAWRNLGFILRHAIADKRIFSTHKQ